MALPKTCKDVHIPSLVVFRWALGVTLCFRLLLRNRCLSLVTLLLLIKMFTFSLSLFGLLSLSQNAFHFGEK
jgi:hypothetical protein